MIAKSLGMVIVCMSIWNIGEQFNKPVDIESFRIAMIITKVKYMFFDNTANDIGVQNYDIELDKVSQDELNYFECVWNNFKRTEFGKNELNKINRSKFEKLKFQKKISKEYEEKFNLIVDSWDIENEKINYIKSDNNIKNIDYIIDIIEKSSYEEPYQNIEQILGAKIHNKFCELYNKKEIFYETYAEIGMLSGCNYEYGDEYIFYISDEQLKKGYDASQDVSLKTTLSILENIGSISGVLGDPFMGLYVKNVCEIENVKNFRTSIIDYDLDSKKELVLDLKKMYDYINTINMKEDFLSYSNSDELLKRLYS